MPFEAKAEILAGDFLKELCWIAVYYTTTFLPSAHTRSRDFDFFLTPARIFVRRFGQSFCSEQIYPSRLSPSIPKRKTKTLATWGV